MKHLFNPEDDSYTEEGMALNYRTTNLIKDLFTEYQNQGYSIRQVASIMEGAVNEWMLIQILTKQASNIVPRDCALNKPELKSED